MSRKRAQHGATRISHNKKPFDRRIIYWTLASLAFVTLSTFIYIHKEQFTLGDYPINSVRVETRLQNVSQEQIRNIVAAYAGEGFFQLNVDQIKQELELLAWVDSAAVKRQWPDKVVVQLLEHKPIAFWGDEGMINSRGELFFPELTSSKYGDLPVFIGPDGSSASMLQAFNEMNNNIVKTDEMITHLEMNARRAWKIELQNGMRLQLGRENFTARFNRFRDVYEQTVSKYIDVIELIDLRYTNGFSVQWREGAQPEITG